MIRYGVGSLDLEGDGVFATESISKGSVIVEDEPVLKWNLDDKLAHGSATDRVSTVLELLRDEIGQPLSQGNRTSDPFLLDKLKNSDPLLIQKLQDVLDILDSKSSDSNSSGTYTNPFTFVECVRWYCAMKRQVEENRSEQKADNKLNRIVGRPNNNPRAKNADTSFDAVFQLKPFRAMKDRRQFQELQVMIGEILRTKTSSNFHENLIRSLQMVFRLVNIVECNAFVQLFDVKQQVVSIKQVHGTRVVDSETHPTPMRHLVLYPILSKINHSCQPYAWIKLDGNLVALEDIEKDTEVTWNYRQKSQRKSGEARENRDVDQITNFAEERNDDLRSRERECDDLTEELGFKCRCKRCSSSANPS